MDAEESIPELLARLEREHVQAAYVTASGEPCCLECQEAWPCDSARLVAHIRSLELPKGLEDIVEWARRHPNQMWHEYQAQENEATRLQEELERMRAAQIKVTHSVVPPLDLDDNELLGELLAEPSTRRWRKMGRICEHCKGEPCDVCSRAALGEAQ